MTNIIPFQFDAFSVRTVEISGEILFIAKDVALCLGYERPSDAVSQHCKKAKSLKSLGYGDLPIPYLMSEFGTTNITVIHESDVYRLVMRSKLESAENFQDWVVEEVIPSIRKTGGYQLNGLNLRDNAQLTAVALQLIEINQEQAEQIKVLEPKPKAKAIDRLRAVDGSVCISEAAKMLGVKRDEFFEFLHKIKWIFKRGAGWLGYETARTKGFVDHRPVDANGKIRTQCVLTPKGLSEIAVMMDSGVAI